ncbi:plastocyanin/azurin family copper-binding protein [Halomicroarcula sp. S3CR25-11]|uniref:Plastocyanin/azurin family copper-binding protein n=1 Tax=Haloarcula onubensis TaxID=2950539 RepID=A0ABU2FLM9_9EURY|nr:plastocyanin/azurin family copper-binding protein [Halomicroarcula sp. S3CR25-11]
MVHERGDFESDLTAEEGSTFEHTFESAGTYLYYCAPHLGFGMRGAVVVE